MNDKCNEIIETCIKRWDCDERDERIVFFKDKFEKWFDSFNTNEQKIVGKLLDNFIYYDKQKCNISLVELHKKLMQSSKDITIENTVFTYIISDDGESNSSNDYWHEYKQINFEKGKKYFSTSLEKYFSTSNGKENISNIKNVVFIDDFSGTGKSLSSFLDKIKEIKEILKLKNIYLVVIHAMSEGIEHLKNENIEVVFCNKQDKAFSNGYFETNADESKNIIIEKSVNLGIHKKYILGRKDTQSLVAFYENTPNNTLGIFSCPTKSFNVIFPRDEHQKCLEKKERKLEEMIDNTKKRGIKNYNSASRV